VIDPPRSFDRAADAYERTRPDYPDALLELVPVRADATVLDLGAGTGKLTRVLARRYRQVIAVEPLDGMRTILEAVVPEAESRAGRAEAIPLAEASVDAVFAAQAFHWFANEAAVAEIARVLRPGGVLALVWNDRDEGRPDPLPSDYRAYLGELRAIAEFEQAPPWHEVLGVGPFGELHEACVPHDHVLDRRGLLDNARSVSWIARRGDAEQSSILERLGELLPDGIYAVPNRANVLWTVRV
jgi:SAM-dependent methyltransferase